MEESEILHVDLEYKRYLQILRPYLGQLVNKHAIAICNAWIQRLSDCSEEEKSLRNRYIFTLCYQLAKGGLEGPFLNYPPSGNLPPLSESICSEDFSTEVECLVIDAEDPYTEVLFNTKKPTTSDTEYMSQTNEYERINEENHECDSIKSSKPSNKYNHPLRKHTVVCYTCPEMLREYINCDPNEAFEYRANNLIRKLREIKTQNTLLHSELLALKEESTSKHDTSYVDENIIKTDNATSALMQNKESSSTLKSLKCKFQEVQQSRNDLIDKIAVLQDELDNYKELKKQEIDSIEAKHKLEIINIKGAISDEVKMIYEKKIEELKLDYESKINEFSNKSSKDIQDLTTAKDDEIVQINKIINIKDLEINKLKNQVDDLRSHLHTLLEKLIDTPTDNFSGDNNMKVKTQQLEKRLEKMEKSKVKCTRIYEAKVAQLQREKHLAECSLQLQMVRQRAQVVNEVTDENQTELAAALDKLETKYKEIVANVQATAIQRRMHDQIVLESILQAACGIPHENNSHSTNGQFSNTIRNQTPGLVSGVSPLLCGNKVGSVHVGNKPLGEDSLVTGYCLNGERMGELFERVYIPQRDNPETMK